MDPRLREDYSLDCHATPQEYLPFYGGVLAKTVFYDGDIYLEPFFEDLELIKLIKIINKNAESDITGIVIYPKVANSLKEHFATSSLHSSASGKS